MRFPNPGIDTHPIHGDNGLAHASIPVSALTGSGRRRSFSVVVLW